ncbi:MAG TPA: phage tail assembly protein [Sphingomonas sp.]
MPIPAPGATEAVIDAYLESVDYQLTVKLRQPIPLGEITFSELRLREPTAAEWKRWDRLSGIEADIMAVSVVAGVPDQVIAQIGARELMKAARFILLFLS